MKIRRPFAKIIICSLLAVALCATFVRAQSQGVTIQIASAPSEAEARSTVADLRAKGIEAYWVKAEVPGVGTRYRVRIGRFKNRTEAKVVADRHLASGAIKEFIITPYDAPAAESVARKEPKPETKPAPAADQIGADKLKVEKSAGKESQKRQTQKPEPALAERAQTESAKPSDEKSVLASVEPATKPKPEIKTEAAKPSAEKDSAEKTAPDPAEPEAARKTVSPSPALESNSGAAILPKISTANPAIVTPPMPEALADVTISNDNWKVVRRSVESEKNLRVIHFVDSMTGWAAGDAGAVYRTTDGGKTWKPLLSGAAANINFIYFVDWNHGWMLGETSGKAPTDENEGETVLLSTTNGGRTWDRKPLPNVLSLYFTDAKNGWAVGRNATLLRTSDGGAEWTKVETIEKLIGLPVESSNYNFGFRDIYFTDAQHGWLIGNFYGRARSHLGGIFATTDGGATWKRVPVTFQTQYTSGRFTPGLLHSVRFTDTNTGSVTGEMYDGEGRFFFALHTRDGGRSWDQFRTPSRATHSTQFLDLANGWTAAFAPREGAAEAVVYDTTLMRTDNGGMSWRNDFVARGRRIRGVFFLSPTKGWAVGDRGMILRYEEKSKAN
jgi:photosystem II stability/assembly factor-like uncharacterized protein